MCSPPDINIDKYCFVYCGDEYCDCQHSKLRLPVTKKYAFEDKYEVLNMYSYLNHPHYNNFTRYLKYFYKIALIFCKSDDEVFNIVKSDLIKVYKVANLEEREKILKELRKDFDAYQSTSTLMGYYMDSNWITIEPDNKLLGYSITEIIIDEVKNERD